MSQDFKKDYLDYLNKNTPSFWDRIEERLDEEAEKGTTEFTQIDGTKETEETEEKKEGRRVLSFPHRWATLGAAAAVLAVCLLGAGGLRLGQRNGEAAVKDTGGTEEALLAKAGDRSLVTIGQTEVPLAGAPVRGPEAAEAETEWLSGDVTTTTEAVTEAEAALYGVKAGEVFEEPAAFYEEDILYEDGLDIMPMESLMGYYGGEAYGESYAPIGQDGFYLTATDPLSTFAADVDTASYANVRRMIENGCALSEIWPDSVRIEEFVNYFHYDVPDPQEGTAFGCTAKVVPCPWREGHELLFLGMKTEDISLEDAPRENITLLLDVSGSMDDPDKLPLVKRAMLALLEELDEEDQISVVTYADGVQVLLENVPGSEKKEIRDCIDSLSASGGTYGEGGIQKAYELAEEGFSAEANNRILLATDGDLNIGISEPEELKALVSEKRDQGIFLSVLGFGTGNLRDDNMESLADWGNGTYHYIDTFTEAKKVLVEEMGSSLHVVAKDVKLQLEFNPAVVNAYRQLGYEDRRMAAVDFRDDSKDGGEVGAGQVVIALYELIPAGAEDEVTLTYASQDKGDSTDYGTLRIRYKEPLEDKAREEAFVIGEDCYLEADEDAAFAGAAAELGLILRGDAYKGEASLGHLMARLDALDFTKDEYRMEMYFLVRLLSKRE